MVARDVELTGQGLTGRLAANVTVGTEYFILVVGAFNVNPAVNRGSSGEAVLNINANGNDFFTNAQPLSGANGTITGTTLFASIEPGEPRHAGNAGGHSIWYSWTAPFGGGVVFDTFGSRFNTVLSIYSGSSLPGTLIAENDDAAPDGLSRVTFEAEAGMTYRIAVDGHAGEAGLATLNWRPPLRLLAPKVVGGGLEFTLVSLKGERCLVETSHDLTHWTPWLRVTDSSGTVLVSDVLEVRPKYYRVRSESTP